MVPTVGATPDAGDSWVAGVDLHLSVRNHLCGALGKADSSLQFVDLIQFPLKGSALPGRSVEEVTHTFDVSVKCYFKSGAAKKRSQGGNVILGL